MSLPRAPVREHNARMNTIATPVTLALLACGVLVAPAARAADPAPKPAATAKQRADRAKDLGLAHQTVQRISEAQLQAADRVLTGDASCELDQTVNLEPMADRPGHFRLRFRNASYTMVPEETSTGAVRLEDKKAGMVWLQIPSKSMLMNTRIGQRVADGCLHPSQRAALSASEGAAAATPERKP
jgi:hypothetical protein